MDNKSKCVVDVDLGDLAVPDGERPNAFYLLWSLSQFAVGHTHSAPSVRLDARSARKLPMHLVRSNVDNESVTKGKVAPSRWIKTGRVPWGAVWYAPLTGYFTWVSVAAVVYLSAWLGLGILTDRYWMGFAALPGAVVFWVDFIATNVITFRRDRHNRKIQKARKAREARKAQKP